jgi:hypothetical protein
MSEEIKCTIACDLKMKQIPQLHILIGKQVKRIDNLQEDNRKLKAANDHMSAALDDFGGVTELVKALEYIDGQLYTLVYTDGAVKRCRSHLMKAVTKTKNTLAKYKKENYRRL